MKFKSKLFIFCLLFMTLATSLAYAKASALEALLAFPDRFDQRRVQIEGEVIGEPLNDAQGVWLNISTGPQQVGVFSSDKNLIERIAYWGSYQETGDWVRVKGVFYKECPDHQISDVHLESLEIIREGYVNEYSISPQKQQLAKILSIICLIIAFIYLIKLKYGKRD